MDSDYFYREASKFQFSCVLVWLAEIFYKILIH